MANKNNYKLVKAKLKDFNRAYGIILECSKWLKSKGIKQWNPPYPKKLYKQEIISGNVYFFTKGKIINGVATLSRKPPVYYPRNLRRYDKNVMYICRLAVPRKFKGKEIGKKMLQKIEILLKSDNIKKLKLDIMKSNKFLNRYYKKAGFISVKEYIPPKKWRAKLNSAIIMEKIILK
ncbi:GNAT family N-acetyltransferase [Candidatus Woesearchaeota archaeon]|nr:GNAT family N-acetyltransferase [Candidatus Woesearchaeota archaeon]